MAHYSSLGFQLASMYRGGSASYKDSRGKAWHQEKFIEMQMKSGAAGKSEEKLIGRDPW